jgi:2-polyprenyl-3-methyl-5-hydroxy-6-metoxy-1,4-benzoquinol methylase
MGKQLETIKCNICGKDDTELFLSINGVSYKRCVYCGLVYQNPRPVFGNLKKHYGDDYFDYEYSNQGNFFNLMKLGLKDIGFDSLFQRDYNRRRFLDIGCATGLLLNYMKRKGWIAQGVEICSASAGYAIENFGVDVYIGTLEDASFPDQYFDVVHLSHLIEHVPDPKKLLLEIRRVLRTGGHMVVTTPNVTGMQARVAQKTWRSAIPEHIYLFSKKTMKTLLLCAGFTVVKQVSWGGIPAGKRPDVIKKPFDRLAKLCNIGDVMLFHCQPD